MTISTPNKPLVRALPRLPDKLDDVLRWARDINTALDDIHRKAMVEALGLIFSGNLAERPAARGSRRLFFALDTHEGYLDTGAAWELLSVGGAAVSVDGVSNPGGDIDLVSSDVHLVITPDDWANDITFTPYTPYLNVKAYGAVGNGVADDTTAIAATIAALPATGGVVFFPPGVYKVTSTLTIGNGSSSAASSRNNVALLGCGIGPDPLQWAATGAVGATRLLWGGARDGTMLQVAGPIAGFALASMILDGADEAGTLLNLGHPFQHQLQHVLIEQWRGWAVKLWAYAPYTGAEAGAAPDLWDWQHVVITDPALSTSSCLRIGDPLDGGGNLSGLGTFSVCKFNRGDDAAAASVRVGYVDHVEFHACYATHADGTQSNVGIALDVAPPAAHPEWPTNIELHGGAWIGGINQPAARTADGQSAPAVVVYGWATADGEPDPPVGSNASALDYGLVNGFSDRGNLLGYVRGLPMWDAARTAFSTWGGATGWQTVATFSLPAGRLRPDGTVVRVIGGGVVTGDGTGGVQIRVTVGGQVIATFALTPAACTHEAWWLFADCTIRTGGTSGTGTVGGGVLTYNGAVVGNIAVGTIALDTDSAPVAVNIDWNWLSSTGSYERCEHYTVDVLHRRWM